MIIYFASAMTYSLIDNEYQTNHYPLVATDLRYTDFESFVDTCKLFLINDPVYTYSNCHLVCNSGKLNTDGTLTKLSSIILNFYNLKAVKTTQN